MELDGRNDANRLQNTGRCGDNAISRNIAILQRFIRPTLNVIYAFNVIKRYCNICEDVWERIYEWIYLQFIVV